MVDIQVEIYQRIQRNGFFGTAPSEYAQHICSEYFPVECSDFFC